MCLCPQLLVNGGSSGTYFIVVMTLRAEAHVVCNGICDRMGSTLGSIGIGRWAC